MPSVCRLGDIMAPDSAGVSMSITGSLSVFINGIPCHRVTDAWAPHTIPGVDTHPSSNTASGSTTVFVNGLPIARVGDPTSCGSSIQTGSPNVFAN